MADIDTIRTEGNWSDWLILIDDPTVVYTARATGEVAQDDYSLGFDGGSGTLGDCKPDMTLLIGSSAGACDVGIARLRKDPIAGTFYIGVDPSLEVSDDDYLTVLDDFELFAKHSFGEYLDVDVSYSDQFEDFAPIPWFNGRVAVIKAGETIEFDATRSWAPDSTISAYAWTFTGADSSTGTATATPTATYDTSGRYRVDFEVTAANGKNMTGYGFVFVLGDNLEAEKDVLINDPESDNDSGAVCRVVMLDRPTIRDGARAIVFARDWYDGSEQSFGAVDGRENILIDGRIFGGTFEKDAMTERVEFEIGGPILDLSTTSSQICGLIDTSYPDDSAGDLPDWAKLSDLTVAKGLHYLAVYRSTIARCLDFDVEDWGYACPKLTGDGEDLYSQMNTFAERAALHVSADRIGRIFIERDTQLYPIDDRTGDISVVMTFADGDWQGELSVTRRQKPEYGMAEAEGEIFSGGNLTKVGGRSPGNQPARRGVMTSMSELYVDTVGDVLELAGLLAGSGAQEIASIALETAYNIRLFDVAPRQFVNITVDGDTLRCIPRRITERSVEGSGFKYQEIELEPEGLEWPSVAITYPGEDDPPVDPPVDPPYDPPVPLYEPPTPPAVSEGDAVVAIGSDVRTSEDLDEDEPSWATEV